MKQYSHINSVNLITLTGLAFLSTPILIGSAVHADNTDVVDEISITVPASCTMDATGNNSHNANIANGTYDSNIGQTDIKAFCNDNGGFSIYAIGFTNNEYGKNVLTNETLGSTNDIVTGTNISGDTSNWAMKLTKLTSPTPTYPIIIAGSAEDTLKQTNDPDFSNFTNIPDTYTKVAYRTAGTDINLEGQTTAEGTTLSTVYQAYISKTQPAGTYTGQVKYTLVHPYDADAPEIPAQPQVTESGKICYYANATDAVGTMGCQTIPTSGGSADTVSPTAATLLASNFSRTGYGFAGWSDKFDYATNPEAKFYGPQETIAYENGQYVGEGKGLSLYAVWVKSAGNLQDATKVATLCGTGTGSLIKANEATNILSQSITALSDARDNNTYAIAKLADGKCWMIENLRLQNTGADNTNGSLAQGYGGQFAGLANPETADKFTDTYSANSLYSNDGADNTTNIGTSNTAYRMSRYNNINTPASTADRPQNPTTNSATNSTSNASMYSYGNYYSWHAAIADTAAYDSNNTSVTNTSICPTGWHLPKGGQTTVNTTADFYLLGKAIMDNIEPDKNASGGYGYYGNSVTNTAGKTATAAFRSYPNNFVYSGYVFSGSVGNRGSYGYYWSSTAFSSFSAYSLNLSSSNVLPGTGSNYKYSGRSVRCVAPGV